MGALDWLFMVLMIGLSLFFVVALLADRTDRTDRTDRD